VTRLAGNLLKLAIAGLIFYLALTLGAHNANAAFRSYQLEAKLPTAVPVFCTDNINGPGYALIWQREIYLDSTDCQSLLNNKPSSTDGHGGQSWALHAHTLLHEWVHVAFQTWDEKRVECITYSVYRYWLHAYWNLSAPTALTFYRATAIYSPYAPLGCVL
jgi:hypothetical protein